MGKVGDSSCGKSGQLQADFQMKLVCIVGSLNLIAVCTPAAV